MNSRKIIFLKFLLIMLKLNEIMKVMLCQCLLFIYFFYHRARRSAGWGLF
jgi:hypothetical protein